MMTQFWQNVTRVLRRRSLDTEEVNFEHKEGQLALDIYEKEGDIVIIAPLAGVALEDVDILLEDDVLTIKGERKTSAKIPLKKYISQECFWGNFSRSVILPPNIKSSGIKATYKNGILEVLIPKMPKTKSKSIKVSVK